jgi:glycosyltransferase involved in cell wall biosynthesis
MRLEVDLAFDATPTRVTDQGHATLDFDTIASSLFPPRKLFALLRAQSYDLVVVRIGSLPLSAVQGVCLLLLAAVPARRFVLAGREHGRIAFLLHAAAVAIPAGTRELWQTTRLTRHISRFSSRPIRLPSHADSLRTALYLRVSPTLRWYGVQVGGAATHTAGVINGMIDNGVDVDVLAAEQPEGTKRVRFRAVPVARIFHLVWALTNTAHAEALVVAAQGASADFVYERYQLGSNAGLRAAAQLGIPFVLEFNGSELWVSRHWGRRASRLEKQLARLERRNLLDASLVVVVSEALRDAVLAEGVSPERVLVNPNGVDVDALAPYRVGLPSDWRARAGLSEAPTVGFVGTFGLWHGVMLLPALAEAVPEARWVIIGDGSLFADVRTEMDARGLGARVDMVGLVERSRALELLACCDVCVSPHIPNPDGTPFFGSPTKIFEYMGLAKAIVASNLGQIGEVLDHERTALLCEPGDLDEAAAAIRRLLGDAELRARLGAGALQAAEGQYTWTAHVRRILDALRSC